MQAGAAITPVTTDDQEAFLARLRDVVRYAFQPIVNIQTGAVFGYEALLRNHQAVGVATIPDLFDRAADLQVLHRTDMILREAAISAFATLDHAERCMLFFNLDGRIFESEDYHPHQTIAILSHNGVPPQSLCLELSERYDNASAQHLNDTLGLCRQQDYRLAIDDFGRGFSEMKMLYDHQPDFVKIDRYFISGIATDSKKRLMVSTIVDLAHVLGTQVVAEGVETEAEFLACKDVGCDLVQGFFVARPAEDLNTLMPRYEIVAEINRNDRRRKASDALLVRDCITRFETLGIEDSVDAMLDAFRRHKEQSLFPVIDAAGRPVGILREQEIKDFIYMQYGRDLLQNRTYGKRLPHFVQRCPVVDIDTDVGKILEMYALDQGRDGIVVTENGLYLGFLTTDDLLRLVNEKNLSAARDQNPLTKLPGNNTIVNYVAERLDDRATATALVYFDFNDFKPFNDSYGFRQGDRAIMLFADLLRRYFAGTGCFLGHIGGDDFFVGVDGQPVEAVEAKIRELLAAFRRDMESFYTAEDRARGGIAETGRDGLPRHYELLSCSAAMIRLPSQALRPSMETVMHHFTRLKKQAKKGRDPLAVVELVPDTAAAAE